MSMQRILAYAVTTALALLLLVLFARALPDAVSRAKTGSQRAGDAACEGLQPAPQNPTLGSFPTTAPGFVLPDWSGRQISLASLRGKVVLVNFWATWCSTCKVEIPSMEALVSTLKDQPFKLLAISVDDSWAKVRNYFAQGTKLTVLLDQDSQVTHSYGTEKLPESYLIDKEGNIRYYVISDRNWNQPNVVACLNSLIKE